MEKAGLSYGYTSTANLASGTERVQSGACIIIAPGPIPWKKEYHLVEDQIPPALSFIIPGDSNPCRLHPPGLDGTHRNKDQTGNR